MKIYLIISEGLVLGSYTNEEQADNLLSNVIKNNIHAYKTYYALQIDEELIKELAINVLDDVEDMLFDKGIQIPDILREGNEEESALYGETYYNLEDKVIETITNTL